MLEYYGSSVTWQTLIQLFDVDGDCYGEWFLTDEGRIMIFGNNYHENYVALRTTWCRREYEYYGDIIGEKYSVPFALCRDGREYLVEDEKRLSLASPQLPLGELVALYTK